MGSGEDAVGENGVTFVEVVFIGVVFVGVAGNGLMVILSVTEARLSLACRFALVAGGLVLLALLFSVLALAINHRRLKQKSTGPQKPGDGWGVLFSEVFVAPLRNVKRAMIIALCAIFAFMVILLCYHDNFTKRVGGAACAFNTQVYPAEGRAVPGKGGGA